MLFTSNLMAMALFRMLICSDYKTVVLHSVHSRESTTCRRSERSLFEMLAMLAAFLQLSCYTHKVLTVYSVGRGKEKYYCGHYLIATSFVSHIALLTDARLHCLIVVGCTCMSVYVFHGCVTISDPHQI